VSTVSPSMFDGRPAVRGTRVAGDAPQAATTEDDGFIAPGEKVPAPVPRFPRFRSIVKNAPIVGFTGVNGAGKTLVAVSEAMRDMSMGRPVVSTVPISCKWGESIPLLSLRQLLDLRDCTVLIDEVSVIFSSRNTGGLPDEVSTFLQSMRHQAVTLRWTAPAWSRADIQLRQVTQVSVNVMPVGRRSIPGSFWPRPVLVGAAAFDCTSMPVDSTPEKVMRGSRRVWIPSHLPGWGSYDSEADVSRIGWTPQGRTCVDCGGTRRPEPCSPERHQKLGISPIVEQPSRTTLTRGPGMT
jgi:hypothetical protein